MEVKSALPVKVERCFQHTYVRGLNFKVFEPGEDEKNEQEYKKIHEEYKNLV